MLSAESPHYQRESNMDVLKGPTFSWEFKYKEHGL